MKQPIPLLLKIGSLLINKVLFSEVKKNSPVGLNLPIDVGHEEARPFSVDNLGGGPTLDDRTTDFRLCSSAATSALAANSSLFIATFRA